MNRLRVPLVTLAALSLAVGMGSVPAHASTGEVIVFGTEVEPVTTYENPSGCHKLPLSAHVLINKTDGPVQVYGDPLCLSPNLSVAPGHGSHVASGSGSFSAM
ncbi:hypothetical protein AB0D14_07420 [Streptomyces sp. NPDC048484]|uniref:hypothetical protein n=1 Tax=Streptomyces sp. NPDC048484 TaxID=3155146 RepID=UPI00343D13D8